MKMELQSFYDVISYKTGINVNASEVIKAIANHLLSGSVILTSEGFDVAFLKQSENGDWVINFIK